MEHRLTQLAASAAATLDVDSPAASSAAAVQALEGAQQALAGLGEALHRAGAAASQEAERQALGASLRELQQSMAHGGEGSDIPKHAALHATALIYSLRCSTVLLTPG